MDPCAVYSPSSSLEVRGAGDTQLTVIILLKGQEADHVITEALGVELGLGPRRPDSQPGPQATPLSAPERLDLIRDVHMWRAGKSLQLLQDLTQILC